MTYAILAAITWYIIVIATYKNFSERWDTVDRVGFCVIGTISLVISPFALPFVLLAAGIHIIANSDHSIKIEFVNGKEKY